MTVENFKVPGATLHVDVQGSGPTLLIIPGAPADYTVLAPVAAILAEKYRVVTYDLRGMSRSPFDGDPVDLTASDYADDAARVIDQYADGGPVPVLAASGGAVAALDLVTRYPGKVSTLIAHEPPIAGVLDNGAEWIAFFDEVHEVGKTAGGGAAMGLFIASFDGYAGPEKDESKGEFPGFPMPDFTQLTPEQAEFFQRMGSNSEVFVNHIIRATPRYEPDYDALKASDTKIVVALGETSKAQFPHRAAAEVAKNLGVEPVYFVGGHDGFGDAQGWAAGVERALS